MDGVQYSATGAVVAIWAHSLATSKRHLLALVRKKQFRLDGSGELLRKNRNFESL